MNIMSACKQAFISIATGECGRDAKVSLGGVDVDLYEFTFDREEAVFTGDIVGNMQTVAKYVGLSSGSTASIEFINVEDETDRVSHYVFRLEDRKDLSIEYVYVLVEDGEIYYSPFNWSGESEWFQIPVPEKLKEIW